MPALIAAENIINDDRPIGRFAMTRFSRWPSIEELEQKRLKAADLINNICADGGGNEPASAAALSSGRHVAAIDLQAGDTSKASLTSEQADDESENENEESETDDADESAEVDQP